MHISDKISDKILNYKIADKTSDKNLKIPNFGQNFGQNFSQIPKYKVSKLRKTKRKLISLRFELYQKTYFFNEYV